MSISASSIKDTYDSLGLDISEAVSSLSSFIDIHIHQLSDEPSWLEYVSYVQRTWNFSYINLRHVENSLPRIERISKQAAIYDCKLLRDFSDLAFSRAIETGCALTLQCTEPKTLSTLDVHAIPFVEFKKCNPIGALICITDSSNEHESRAIREEIHAQISVLRNKFHTDKQNLPQTETPYSGSQTAGLIAMDPLSELLSVDYDSITELATAIADRICHEHHCNEVAIGSVFRGQVTLSAHTLIATSLEVSTSPIILADLMGECLDQGTVVYAQQPSVEASTAAEMPLHQRWRAKTGNSCCVSIPVYIHNRKNDRTCHLVLAMRRSEQRFFTDIEISNISQSLSRFGGMIALLNKKERTSVSQFPKSWALQRLSQKSSNVQLALIAAFIAFLVFMSVPWSDAVVVEGRLQSRLGHTYTSPIEGRLSKVYVHVGDRVNSGQVLFEMDTTQIASERNALNAQIDLHRVRLVDALKNRDPSSAAAEHQRYLSLMEKLHLLDQQISVSRVHALTSGVITEAEGYQKKGEILPFGTKVLQVSPSDMHEVELLVEDHLFDDLQPGAKGWFAGAGEPDSTRPLTVSRIEATARNRDGRNLISAWAFLDAPAANLPYGAQGYARIDVGKRTGWWIFLVKPLSKLKCNFLPV